MHDAPIIVVGAGPVGMTFAMLMARYGTPTIVLERKTEISDHPRAHYLNTRTLELFRQWECDDLIMEGQLPQEHMPTGLLAMMGGADLEERERVSPSIASSVAQDIVEHSILKKLETYGKADLRWGWTVHSVTDKGDRVEVDAESPTGERQVLTSRWCIASDGAGSATRKSLGIEMLGDPCLDRVINMYFIGQIIDDRDTPTLGARSRDPEIPGAFINMDSKGRHCFHYLMSEGEEIDTYLNDFELCEQYIRRAAAMPPERTVDLRAVKPWTMTALVAERMRAGNIFLCGDAAHAFPPSGGFGLNSGVGDVHNLAWKIQAVLDGRASDGLLDTYIAERQPVAFLNTSQSFRNAVSMNLRGVPKPFSVTDEVLEFINKGAEPTGVRSVAEDIEDDDNRKAAELIEHGAPMGQEIGYAYTASPAIIDDGKPRVDMTVGRYIPNASPGGRAPHFWVNTASGRMSSLDLFEKTFTLLTGSGGDAWRSAASSLDQAELSQFAVGEGLDGAPETEDFLTLYGISADGAVLVRPDGHVAFRSETAVANPAEVLQGALNTAYGRAAAPVQREAVPAS